MKTPTLAACLADATDALDHAEDLLDATHTRACATRRLDLADQIEELSHCDAHLANAARRLANSLKG